MYPSNRHDLLRQIAAIPVMERGKLSTYSLADGPGAAGPYYKIQRWEDGKNHTQHVPAEAVPAVQAAVAGYARFQELTTQYADLVIAETRQNLADAKKNRSRHRSSSPKKRKSNS
jgi:quinol monooxygenase YgiN